MAQDVIVKKDGSTILAKVTKVGEKEIEYKKFKSESDRLYSISTSSVMIINYEDGEKEVFNNDNIQNTQFENASINSGPKYINLSPDTNNSELIRKHNSNIQFAKQSNDKDAHYFFPIMAMSDSSIISNKEIEMRIVPTIVNDQNIFDSYIVKYTLELKNKTNKIIYVDLANSFRLYTDGTSESYYDNEQTTISHGNSNGVGANLGGIAGAIGINGPIGTLASAFTVGGSSQHGVSSTYTQERILAIPPHSKKYLKEYKQVQTKTKTLVRDPEYKTISDLDSYGFSLNSLRGVLKKGGHISYTEEESPYYAKHLITYSCTSDFSTYSQLYAKLYARYVVGGYYSEWVSNREKLIKEIKKYIMNFWDDAGVMVGEATYIAK